MSQIIDRGPAVLFSEEWHRVVNGRVVISHRRRVDGSRLVSADPPAIPRLRLFRWLRR